MAIKVQPLADYVVAVNLEAATKTASGLYLPEKAAEKPKVARVVAIGPGAKQIKVGDQIIYKNYSQTDVKVEGTEYLLVREEDVLATVQQ